MQPGHYGAPSWGWDQMDHEHSRAAEGDPRRRATNMMANDGLSAKRPRDEAEYDDFDRMSRWPPASPKRARQDDYRGPQSPWRSPSPYHRRRASFREYRDQHDRYSPPYQDVDAYQDRRPLPRRPSFENWRDGPGNGYSPTRGRSELFRYHGDNSPVERRIGPRSSSPPRGGPSPDTIRDRPPFRNMSWTNPDGRPPLPKSNDIPKAGTAAMLRREASSREEHEAALKDAAPSTVEFRGLKRVPTGPKAGLSTGPKAAVSNAPKSSPRAPSDTPDLEIPPLVPSHIWQGPHIYIPAEDLPPKRKTMEHINGFCFKFMRRELDIAVDQTGYYIRFEDNQRGMNQMAKLRKAAHKRVFFGMYTLNMIPQPNGQKLDSTGLNPIRPVPGRDAGLRVDTSPDPTPQLTSVAMSSPVIQADVPQLEERQPSAEQQALSHAGPAPRPPMSTPSLFQSDGPSSPPLSFLRHEKSDSASSVSGFTDMSGSKQNRCHVCSGGPVSESDALVHCSACSRRFHRRCQNPPATSIDASQVWRCRRCVKKKKAPKDRLSSMLPTVEASAEPMESTSGSREAELEQPRESLGSPHSDANRPPPIATFSNRTTFFAADIMHSPVDTSMSEDAVDSGKDVGSPKQLKDDAAQSHDPPSQPTADELVERSFTALSADSGASTGKARPSKPMISRKKIKRPANGDSGKIQNASASDPKQAVSPSATESVRHEQMECATEPQLPSQASELHRVNRKPHRWSGVGADRDIIKAGEETWGKPSQSRTDQGTMDTHRAMECAIEREVDIGNNTNDNVAGPNKSLPLHLTSSVTQSPSVAQSGGNPRAQTAKKKNRSSHSVKCSRCEVPFALIPGMRATLCRSCRTVPVKKPEAVAVTDMMDHSIAEQDKAAGPSNPNGEGAGKDVQQIPAVVTDVDASGGPPLPRSSSFMAAPRTVGPAAAADTTKQPKHFSTDRLPTSTATAPLAGQRAEAPKLDSRTAPDETTQMDCDVTTDDDYLSSIPPSEPPASNVGDETDVPLQGARKRKRCFRVPAKSDTDLGNSTARPKNSYVKLIGLALCDRHPQPMTGKDIILWIVENISSYEMGVGNWESGLMASMSMYQEGNSNNYPPLWKATTKEKTPFQWQLLPGVKETLLQWDPVIREPVMPDKSWVSGAQAIITTDGGQKLEKTVDESWSSRRSGKPSASLSVTEEGMLKTIKTIKTLQEGISKVSKRSVRELSSDDEPLSAQRSRTTIAASPNAASPNVSLHFHQDTEPMDLDDPTAKGPVVPTELPIQPPPQPPSKRKQLQVASTQDEVKLTQQIEADTEIVDATVTSLLDEWPEYAFDYDAKRKEIAETRKAIPNKKYRPRQLQDPWYTPPKHLSLAPAASDSRNTSVSLDKPARMPRKNVAVPIAWNLEDGGEREFASFDEMFGVPENVLPIVVDGQLAFRDGTRNEDGTLPRAREIFKVGYL